MGDPSHGAGRRRVLRARAARATAVVALLAAALAPGGVAAAAAAPDAAPPHIVDLGTMYGFCCSQATGINDQGHVVGSSAVGERSDPPVHAFLWRQGTFTDLGTLGGESSYATGVNNHDEVVGYSYTRDPDDPDNHLHAFLWRAGHLTDLGTLGGPDSLAYGINDHGEVVGLTWDAAGNPLSFVWRDGVMHPVAHRGTIASVSAVNDNGRLAGALWSTTQTEFFPAFWTNGAHLQEIAHRSGIAYGIDPNGDLAGNLSDGHAFVWRAGTHAITALPRMPDGSSVGAAAIDDNCDVVGSGPGPVPLLWTGCHTLHVLPGLPGGPGTGIAQAVNASGVIAGSAWDNPSIDDGTHAVIWTR